MNTTLLIMAAGIGSRFGNGLKQLTPVGINNEVLMEYAISDAISVGFNKIIFVIRKDIEEEFHKQIGSKLNNRIKVEYAYQELNDLPKGYHLRTERQKPWGTGHAVLAARNLIKEPFAVINADDYYGQEGFEKIHDFLVSKVSKTNFCMAGFILKNTLSDHGAVTRGLCRINQQNEVIEITETPGITKTSEGPACIKEDGSQILLDPDSFVSMNMWGFSDTFMLELEEKFKDFLDENIKDNKAEYLLPTVVDSMIKAQKAKLNLLPTKEHWYGMTYKEDSEIVKTAIKKMVKEGRYPQPLF